MLGLMLGARPHPLRQAIMLALFQFAQSTATAEDGTRQLLNVGSGNINPNLFLGQGLDAAVEPIAIRTGVEVLKDVGRTFLATVEVPDTGGTYRWVAGKKWGAFFGVNATNVTFRLGGGQEIVPHNASPGDIITFMTTRWNDGTNYTTYCKVSTGSSALITGANHNAQALGDFAIGCRLNTDDTIDTNPFNGILKDVALICETWNDAQFEAYLQQPETLWWWENGQHHSDLISQTARDEMAAGHGFVYALDSTIESGGNYYAWDKVKGDTYQQASATLIEGMTQLVTQTNAAELEYGLQTLPRVNVLASSSLYARLQYAMAGYDLRDDVGNLSLYLGYPFQKINYTVPADRGWQGYDFNGNTYYVDSVNGSDSTGDGSQGNPYQSFSMQYNADNANNKVGGSVDLLPGDTLVLKGDFIQDLIVCNTVGLQVIGVDAIVRGRMLVQAVNGTSSDIAITGLSVTYEGSPYDGFDGSDSTKMVSFDKTNNVLIDEMWVGWSSAEFNRTQWEYLDSTKSTNAMEFKDTCSNVTVQHSEITKTALGISMSASHSVVQFNNIHHVTDDFYRLRGNHISLVENIGYQSIKVSDTHGDFCQITHPDLVGDILEPHVVNNRFVNYSDPNRDSFDHTSLDNLVGNVQGVIATDCTPVNPIVDGNLIAITSPNAIAVQNCAPQYNTIFELEPELTNPTYADPRWSEYCDGVDCSMVKAFATPSILVKDSDLGGRSVTGNIVPEIKFVGTDGDVSNNTVEIIKINEAGGAVVTDSNNLNQVGSPTTVNRY